MRREAKQWGGGRGRIHVFLLGLALCTGCGWLQPAQQPPVNAQGPDDLATGVQVVGTPFHRILIGPARASRPTRLAVLYVRIESVADETFWVRPAEVTLVQPDGVSGVALDRDRAQALLERRDVLIVDADPSRDSLGLDRTAEAQYAVRSVIQNELLVDTEVQRDRPARGYVIVDMRREPPSFDGVTLQVGLTRVSDGKAMRQVYRFETAPVATADTPSRAAP